VPAVADGAELAAKSECPQGQEQGNLGGERGDGVSSSMYRSRYGWNPPPGFDLLTAPAESVWSGTSQSRTQAEVLAKRLVTTRADAGWQLGLNTDFDFECLRALSGSRRLLVRHLMDVLPHVPPTAGEMLPLVETLLKQRFADEAEFYGRSTKSAQVAVPLRATLATSTKPSFELSVLGREVILASSLVIGSDLPDTLTRRGIAAFPELQSPSWVFIEARGYHAESFWEDADGVWSLVLGAVETVCNFLAYKYSWGARRHSVAAVERPHHFYIAEDRFWKQHGLEYFFPVGEQKPPESLSDSDMESIRFVLAPLINSPDKRSTARVVVDALRLYSQAVEQPYTYASVLHFWQMAEALTLAEESRGDTSRVAKRLAITAQAVLGERIGLEQFLRDVGDRRNDIVHRGLHTVVDDEALGVLRACCEACLNWIIRSAPELPSVDHIERFYTIAKETEGQRALRKEVDAFVERVAARSREQQ
jgi:hypothetical protein